MKQPLWKTKEGPKGLRGVGEVGTGPSRQGRKRGPTPFQLGCLPSTKGTAIPSNLFLGLKQPSRNKDLGGQNLVT